MNYWNIVGFGLAVFLAALTYTPWWMNAVVLFVAVAHLVSLFSKRWAFYSTWLNVALSAVVVGFAYPYISFVAKAFPDEHMVLEGLFVFYFLLGIVGVLAGEKHLSLNSEKTEVTT